MVNLRFFRQTRPINKPLFRKSEVKVFVFVLLVCGVTFLVTLFGTYHRTNNVQLSISLGISMFFGLFTIIGLIYAILSVKSAESLTEDVKDLVKELILPIDSFPIFVEEATKIVKSASENDTIITLSVTPALGEVLSPILHMRYKMALAERISDKELDVTFYHPKCEKMLAQFNKWAQGETKDDKGAPVDFALLRGKLLSFLSDVHDAMIRGKGNAKSVCLEGISVPPFLVVLSNEEIAVCIRPEGQKVKPEDFKGFHTKSQSIKDLFRKAVVELKNAVGGEEYDISHLLTAIMEESEQHAEESQSSASESLPE